MSGCRLSNLHLSLYCRSLETWFLNTRIFSISISTIPPSPGEELSKGTVPVMEQCGPSRIPNTSFPDTSKGAELQQVQTLFQPSKISSFSGSQFDATRFVRKLLQVSSPTLASIQIRAFSENEYDSRQTSRPWSASARAKRGFGLPTAGSEGLPVFCISHNRPGLDAYFF